MPGGRPFPTDLVKLEADGTLVIHKRLQNGHELVFGKLNLEKLDLKRFDMVEISIKKITPQEAS